jgi:hypothetical protein
VFLPSQGQGRGSDRVLCSSGQLLGVHSFAEINLQMLLAKGSNLMLQSGAPIWLLPFTKQMFYNESYK